MHRTLHLGLLLLAFASTAACSKKEGNDGKGGTAASKSGLPWEPINYKDMGPQCRKALACCEEVATAGGAKSADDYNLKCSGPAMWKEGECDADLKARVSAFEADGKTAPASCK